MKYVYNKLVRDKIPEQINTADGRSCRYKILDNDEYIQELNKKLLEEAHEFIEEHSVEELGDLMEVIFSIMVAKNISIEQVEEKRKIKKDKKGGFQNKIYLLDVDQNFRDEKEELELSKKWRNNS